MFYLLLLHLEYEYKFWRLLASICWTQCKYWAWWVHPKPFIVTDFCSTNYLQRAASLRETSLDLEFCASITRTGWPMKLYFGLIWTCCSCALENTVQAVLLLASFLRFKEIKTLRLWYLQCWCLHADGCNLLIAVWPEECGNICFKSEVEVLYCKFHPQEGDHTNFNRI